MTTVGQKRKSGSIKPPIAKRRPFGGDGTMHLRVCDLSNMGHFILGCPIGFTDMAPEHDCTFGAATTKRYANLIGGVFEGMTLSGVAATDCEALDLLPGGECALKDGHLARLGTALLCEICFQMRQQYRVRVRPQMFRQNVPADEVEKLTNSLSKFRVSPATDGDPRKSCVSWTMAQIEVVVFRNATTESHWRQVLHTLDTLRQQTQLSIGAPTEISIDDRSATDECVPYLKKMLSREYLSVRTV